MAELRDALVGAGFGKVRSYIQSGNLILDSTEPATAVQPAVGDVIDQLFNVQPSVQVLSVEELSAALAANPFEHESVEMPTNVHLFFLSDDAPSVDLARAHDHAVDGERAEVADGVIYVLTPDGIGRSKLASRIARALGDRTTARNYRTVVALRDLAIAE